MNDTEKLAAIRLILGETTQNNNLTDAWEQRSKLFAEGNKLRAEGYKLFAEGSKLYAEGDKLFAEGSKLRAEGNKLRAEGNKLFAEGDLIWANAVIAEHGPKCTITYDSKGCTLGSGEKFYLDN